VRARFHDEGPITVYLGPNERHPIRIPVRGAVLTVTVTRGKCSLRYTKATPGIMGRRGRRPWSDLSMGPGDSWTIAAPEQVRVVTNGGSATVQLLWKRWPRPSGTQE
jgi:hypothetical protein